jgi:hypothetical protein
MEKVTAPVQEPGEFISRKELHELTIQKTKNEIATLQMLNRKSHPNGTLIGTHHLAPNGDKSKNEPYVYTFKHCQDMDYVGPIRL